ncbi:Twinfilin-1 [Vermiconidia calcicola]|uniref:Twinfilin-1 n=1 Tax=Vermiconidia calcicola TaxID=1690605 RepID=A0ACC3MQK5_9PEZI|nr:Twinfilin-1 [Vermiconidia calcicola]
MQSGISASEELQTAFRALVSADDQRALLASIQNESLIPTATVPLTSTDFTSDLHQLHSHLSTTSAAYILLKTHLGEPNGYVAITYVPNTAPVRQKMLFASTRLTLVRELGIERFRRTVFVTEREELTAEGWRKGEESEGVQAPLTEEERGLEGVKEAEARESQGTGGRRGHVSSKVDVATGEGVVEALKLLSEEGCRGTLVQLKYMLPDETLQLDSSTDNVQPADVSSAITASEPRYSFYSHPSPSSETETNILFIYTCPTTSKNKERMIYSTGKSWTRTVAERDAGLTIAKSLEATEPKELDVDVLGGGAEQESGRSTPVAGGGGFARPKRPGRR